MTQLSAKALQGHPLIMGRAYKWESVLFNAFRDRVGLPCCADYYLPDYYLADWYVEDYYFSELCSLPISVQDGWMITSSNDWQAIVSLWHLSRGSSANHSLGVLGTVSHLAMPTNIHQPPHSVSVRWSPYWSDSHISGHSKWPKSLRTKGCWQLLNLHA